MIENGTGKAVGVFLLTGESVKEEIYYDIVFWEQ